MNLHTNLDLTCIGENADLAAWKKSAKECVAENADFAAGEKSAEW